MNKTNQLYGGLTIPPSWVDVDGLACGTMLVSGELRRQKKYVPRYKGQAQSALLSAILRENCIVQRRIDSLMLRREQPTKYSHTWDG